MALGLGVETRWGTFTIVDGCNGLYVYAPDDSCRGAGDGSDMTFEDLIAFAQDDEDEFVAAYGPDQDTLAHLALFKDGLSGVKLVQGNDYRGG